MKRMIELANKFVVAAQDNEPVEKLFEVLDKDCEGPYGYTAMMLATLVLLKSQVARNPPAQSAPPGLNLLGSTSSMEVAGIVLKATGTLPYKVYLQVSPQGSYEFVTHANDEWMHWVIEAMLSAFKCLDCGLRENS